MDVPMESVEGPAAIEQSLPEELEAATAPFVDRWGRLISQTNWEKGRIIFEWRAALAESEAPAAAYADEVWSRHVGGVTPQHVGRLRRVYHRFGEVREQYSGLFWSHFQVALDWEDAEMWLEGAVQNKWSVAKMRQTRAETLGLSQEEAMTPVVAEVDLDEDFTADASAGEGAGGKLAGEPAAAERRTREDDGDGTPSEQEAAAADDVPFDVDEEPQEEAVRPFADLPDLPEDLQEAFETFKLAILRHKADDWSDVQPQHVVAALKSLELLIEAP